MYFDNPVSTFIKSLFGVKTPMYVDYYITDATNDNRRIRNV